MLLIVVRDGGTTVISDNQIEGWKRLYPYVNVKKEISSLDERGILRKYTAKGILKVINRHLEMKNKK